MVKGIGHNSNNKEGERKLMRWAGCPFSDRCLDHFHYNELTKTGGRHFSLAPVIVQLPANVFASFVMQLLYLFLNTEKCEVCVK